MRLEFSKLRRRDTTASLATGLTLNSGMDLSDGCEEFASRRSKTPPIRMSLTRFIQHFCCTYASLSGGSRSALYRSLMLAHSPPDRVLGAVGRHERTVLKIYFHTLAERTQQPLKRRSHLWKLRNLRGFQRATMPLTSGTKYRSSKHPPPDIIHGFKKGTDI